MGYLIKCTECGVEKETKYKTTKFCSDSCRNRYNKRNKGHKKICKQCGKVFYKYKKQGCCSTECLRSYQDKNKKSYIPRQKQIKACVNCNKEYETHQSNSKFCCYECSYEYKVKQKPIHNIKCKECGKWFSTTNKRFVFCSSKCSDKFHDRKKETLRRKRIKKNGRIDWDISIERLIKRDKAICYLCGEQVNINLDSNHDHYPSIEHVIPIAKGGAHTWDNVKLAHRKCNTIKSDTLIYNSK